MTFLVAKKKFCSKTRFYSTRRKKKMQREQVKIPVSIGLKQLHSGIYLVMYSISTNVVQQNQTLYCKNDAFAHK